MLRFPINWLIKFDSLTFPTLNQYTSELKLNHEWRIVCFWHRVNGSMKPHYIEFCRIDVFEDVLIFGTLSLEDHRRILTLTKRNGVRSVSSSQMSQNQKFSKCMESGMPSVAIYLNNCASVSSDYDVKGFVNIFSIREISSFNLQKRECKKCDRLKRLVELSDGLEVLLDPQTCCFSDVSLKCDNASLPAHKNILSARSPVFAAMFKNPMKENNDNIVAIDDIDISSLRIMLTYIYTGKTSHLTVSTALDLFYAADKYQLQDLKRACCDFLKDSISVQNALKILVLGELHSEDMKLNAIDFICNNYEKISALEEWKILKKDRPALVIDVLTSLVKSKEDKSQLSVN